MARIIVLGGGRVGRVIARDLHDDPALEVTVADNREEYVTALGERHGFATRAVDLGDPAAVRQGVGDFDLVVGALPGGLGLQTLEAVIAAKRHLVDISFMPEDPRRLDGAAREAGVTVLYDIGVAPGMSNVLIAKGVRELAPAVRARYLVGGLPLVRRQPWEYEAPFSPADVIEEYIRPARFKVGGKVRVRPALSDVELFDISGVGTLEGFLTDGLRSMLDTIECPDIEEKTLRYPGHAEKIRLLRDSGFLDDREVEVAGQAVNVREFTFRLLDPAWHQAEGTEEFTAMIVEVEGGKDGQERRIWHLLDRTDSDGGETSMARTTGFPAAICVRRILDGSAPIGPGVHPPEALGEDDAFVEGLLADLAARQVIYRPEQG